MKADEIKNIRESLGLTQREFAQKLGVTPLTISHWETGSRRPSSLAVKAILMLEKIEKKDTDKRRFVRETFDRLNRCHFEGILKDYQVELSTRLKRCLGKAFPKRRLIRLSFPHLERKNWQNLEDILKHEMLHCYLYEKGYPVSHSLKFKTMLEKLKKTK